MKNRINIKLFFYPIILVFVGHMTSCNQNSEKKISLFAATGTMLPCNDVCDSILSQNNIHIERNYAASGTLARQIHAGAQADLFISANKQWIDFLNEHGIIIENYVSKIAENNLVVICPTYKNLEIKFSKQFNIQSAITDYISIGDPKYVPAGKYAKQVLDSLGWYKKIRDKIILAKDVTSVLHYVELGECEWGIVYHSEALKSDKVKIAYKIPQELYSPVQFYMALINKTDQSEKVYQYFRSEEAKKIFTIHGFTVDNKKMLNSKF